MNGARSPITTHVLDTAKGKPAAGVPISLFRLEGAVWRLLGDGITNDDGRVADLLPANHRLVAGRYRMSFQTENYFRKNRVTGFYPYADIVFDVREVKSHYHIPLLLSPFGYSTYRGS